MSFEELANDRVTIEKPNGTTTGPHHSVVEATEVTILGADADCEPGDVVCRKLPSGRIERLVVLDATFSPGLHEIPSVWQLKVRKESARPEVEGSRPHITIHQAHGVQIGDHNTQTVVGALTALVKEIEVADAPAAAKVEAKTRLKRFLEHPLVTSVLGAAAGSVLSKL